MMRLVASAAVAVSVLAMAAAPAGASRARWDTRVFALIPRPGFPANAYPAPDGRVYEGTYDDPAGDAAPSRVLEYDGTRGTLQRSWTIRGQRTDEPHGVQVATVDARGRLVLLDKNPPRVLRLVRRTDEQTEYARFPDGAIPNHAVWGPDGSLFVTDYGAPVLWRVPPGGGEPERWFESAQLDGGDFGATGIGLRADRRTLVIAVQSQAGGAGGDPTTGRIFELPIGAGGRPGGPLRQLWESRPFDGPDAFGIARSGRIYIALLAANQLAVIEPDGSEAERFPAGPGGENGSSVPFDAPSSARFLGTRLMVANQAFLTGDPARQAILDVETGEEGLPELIPAGAGSTDTVAPKVTRLRLSARRLRFLLDEPAIVRLTVLRRPPRATAFRRVRRRVLRLQAGRHVRSLRALAGARGRLPAGRWRVVLTAEDADGNRTSPVRRTVRV